jgi:hypothetical protein
LNSLATHLFLKEFQIYVGRVQQFTREDWVAYVLWVGLMSGLLLATGGFVLLGHLNGVQFPAYVWNVPIGTAIFVFAIAFDTIGHRTIYKAELLKGEALVHHITIAAGISSCVFLVMAYDHPSFFRFPILVTIGLSIVYSLVDEFLHWRRYLTQHSDRVEMWSHFFILLGHGIMIFSWWHWYDQGYPGVAETLSALAGGAKP